MNILPVFPVLSVVDAVRAVLGTDPVRIFEDIAPDKTSYPYAVWTMITALPENNLDCPPNIDHVSFQIVVYDTNKTRASEVRKVVLIVIEQYCHVTRFHPNHFERKADTNIFGRGFDANWFLDR